MPPKMKAVARPRFTHFVSFPLRSPTFTNSAAVFRDSLLNATPPISGMHPSIVMAPVRLHLTISLMSLLDEERGVEQAGSRRPKTIQDAIDCLESCRTIVDETINEHRRKRLDIEFNKLSTFQTNLTKCQVIRRSFSGAGRALIVRALGSVCRAHK